MYYSLRECSLNIEQETGEHRVVAKASDDVLIKAWWKLPKKSEKIKYLRSSFHPFGPAILHPGKIEANAPLSAPVDSQFA